MRYRAPLFKRGTSFFYSVWDYVPHVSYLCRTRGGSADVGFHQNGRDRVDASPRDLNYNTCAKCNLSDDD